MDEVVLDSNNICDSCGYQNSESASFCSQCGFPLSDIPYHEDEKRMVTILFADLVGFTTLSEEIGPEKTKELIGESMNIIASKVKKYGGFVNKYLGDGAMAVFGAPRMIENHAEKALHSAIEIQNAIEEFSSQIKQDILFRIGIHTGEVVAGLVGGEGKREYTVLGDAVNVSSRLEGKSEPGKILISGNTYEKTKDFFNFDYKGKLSLKGKTEKVDGYFVVKPMEVRGKVRGIEGLHSPIIGRDEEIKELREILRKTSSKKRLNVVCIDGDAGVGKSRLYSEFINSIKNDNNNSISYFFGRCLPHGTQSAYLPFINAFQSYFGVSKGDEPENITSHIKKRLTGLDLDDIEMKKLYEVMIGLLFREEEESIWKDIDPDDAFERICSTISILLQKISENTTIIFTFEDFHWCDETSISVLKYISRFLIETPIMILLLKRPLVEHKDTFLKLISFLKDKNLLEEIDLKELRDEEIIRIMEELLYKIDIDEDARDMIINNCGGNPFFLEEIIKLFIEMGILIHSGDTWRADKELDIENIPETVEEVILGRVDNLSIPAKMILQRASIFGRIFWKSALREVLGFEMDGSFNELLKSEMIVINDDKTFDDEEEYAFRHDLLYEVVYNSLLESFKKTLHTKVAQWIEKKVKDNPGPYYYLLANHYDKTDNRNKALSYMEKAGDWFKRNYSFNEAIIYYRRTLEIVHQLKKGDNTELRTSISLGRVYRYSGKNKEALEIFDSIVDKVKKPEQKADILMESGNALMTMGKLDQSIDRFLKGLEILKPLPILPITVISMNRIAFCSYMRGDMDNAIRCTKKSLKLLNRLNSADKKENAMLKISTYNISGIVNGILRNYDKSIKYTEEALQLAREYENLEGISTALNSLSNVHYFLMNIGKALKYNEESLDIARLIGRSDSIVTTMMNNGVFYFLIGRYEKSWERYQRALKLSKQINFPIRMGSIYERMAEVLIETNKYEKALDFADKSLNIFKSISHDTGIKEAELLKMKIMIGMQKWDKVSSYISTIENSDKKELSKEILLKFYRQQTEFYIKMFKVSSSSRYFNYFTESIDNLSKTFEEVRESLTPLERLDLRYWWALGHFLMGEKSKALDILSESDKILKTILNDLSAENKKSFLSTTIVRKSLSLMERFENI